MDISKSLGFLKDTSKLITQIYEDVAQPGVRQVGMALESVLGLSNTIMLPLKILNERSNEIFKANMNKFRKNLEEKFDTELNDIPPQLGLPILERLTYISNEELSNMFINVLSTASSKDTISYTHPSYVQLIDRLSIDEARILNYLVDKKFIPYLNFNLQNIKTLGHLNLSRNLTGIEKKIELIYPENMNLYIDNLKSMGLIYSDDISFKQKAEIYNELEVLYKRDIKKIESHNRVGDYSKKLSIKKGYFDITELGKKFISSCTKKAIFTGDITAQYGNTWELQSEKDGKFFKKGLKVKHSENGKGIILGTQLDEIIIIKYDKGETFMIVGPDIKDFEIIK